MRAPPYIMVACYTIPRFANHSLRDHPLIHIPSYRFQAEATTLDKKYLEDIKIDLVPQ